ncbi:MAG TPA: hypothetical protein VF541_04920 [Longimicrobium sp.]|jgi:hypothetical protein
MEAQENKQLALQKAISAHEQAAAALADLAGDAQEERYAALVSRIQQNLAELQADAARTDPADQV